MKLHLPVRLRSALLACCAAVTSLVTTVGAGVVVAGTIAATFTLGGVAAAATSTEVNTAIADAITENGYTAGGAFCITLNMRKDSIPGTQGFVRIDNNEVTGTESWIVNQSKAYWGINTESSNSITEEAEVYSKSKKNEKYIYKASKLSPLWAQNNQLNNSAERGVTNFMDVTIESDGIDSWISLSYDGSYNTDTWYFSGVALDANDISLKDGNVVNSYEIFVSSGSAPVIPTNDLLLRYNFATGNSASITNGEEWGELPAWNTAGYGVTGARGYTTNNPYTTGANLNVSTGFTISLDVRNATDKTILSLNATGGMITINNTGGNITAAWAGNAESAIKGSITLSQWSNLTLVGSKTNGGELMLGLYVDGTLAGEKAISGTGDLVNSTINNMQFGYFGDSSKSSHFDVDNILMYDRALSATEIARLAAYNESIRADQPDIPTRQLLTRFDFSKNSAPTEALAMDWQELPIWQAEGYARTGGTTTSGTNPYTQNADLSANNFTISFDIRNVTSDGTLLGMTTGSFIGVVDENDYSPHSITLTHVDGKITASWLGNTDNAISQSVSLSDWTTLTLVGYKAGEGALTLGLYVDGVLVGEQKNTGVSEIVDKKINKLQLGHYGGISGNSAAFDIDNILLYNCVLTEAEIKQLCGAVEPEVDGKKPQIGKDEEPEIDKTASSATLHGHTFDKATWPYAAGTSIVVLDGVSGFGRNTSMEGIFVENGGRLKMNTNEGNTTVTYLYLGDEIVLQTNTTDMPEKTVCWNYGGKFIISSEKGAWVDIDSNYGKMIDVSQMTSGTIYLNTKGCLTLAEGTSLSNDVAVHAVVGNELTRCLLKGDLSDWTGSVTLAGSTANQFVYYTDKTGLYIQVGSDRETLYWEPTSTATPWTADGAAWNTVDDSTDEATQVAYQNGSNVVFSTTSTSNLDVSIASAVSAHDMTIASGKYDFDYDTIDESNPPSMEPPSLEITGELSIAEDAEGDFSLLSSFKVNDVTNAGTLKAASLAATGAFVSTGGTIHLSGDGATLSAKSIKISGTTLDGEWSATGAVLGAGVSVAADGNVTLVNATLGATVGDDKVPNAGTLNLSGSLNIAPSASFETSTYGAPVYSAGDNGFKFVTKNYQLVNGGTLNTGGVTAVQKDGVAVEAGKYRFDGNNLNIHGERDGTLYWVNGGEAVTYTKTDTAFAGATGFALNGSTNGLVLNSALDDTMIGDGENKGIQLQADTTNKLKIDGATVELAHADVHTNGSGKVQLSGNGIYNLGTAVENLTADDAAIKLGTDWTGTVALNGAALEGQGLNHFAKEGSTVKLSGVTGHFGSGDEEYTGNVALADGTALKLTHGSSDTTKTFSGAISGRGNIELAYSDPNNINFVFSGSVSDWTGKVVMNSANKTSAVSFSGGGAIKASTSVTTGTLDVSVGNEKKKTTINSSIAATTLTITGETEINTSEADTTLTITGETEVATVGSLSVTDRLTTNAALTVNGDLNLGTAVLDGTGSLKVTGALTLGSAENEVASLNKVGSLDVGSLVLGSNSLDVAGALTAGSIDMSGLVAGAASKLTIGSLAADTVLNLTSADLLNLMNGQSLNLLTAGADITASALLSVDGETAASEWKDGAMLYKLSNKGTSLVLDAMVAMGEDDVAWNATGDTGYWFSGQFDTDANVWMPNDKLVTEGDALDTDGDGYIGTDTAYSPGEDSIVVLGGSGSSNIYLNNTLYQADGVTPLDPAQSETKVVEGMLVNYTDATKEYTLQGDDLQLLKSLDVIAGTLIVNNSKVTVGGDDTTGVTPGVTRVADAGKLVVGSHLATDELVGTKGATITVNDDGTLEVGTANIDGTLTNDGTLVVTGQGSTIANLAGEGGLELTTGATATVKSDTYTTLSSLKSDGELTVAGTLEVTGYDVTANSVVEGGTVIANHVVLDSGAGAALDGEFTKLTVEGSVQAGKLAVGDGTSIGDVVVTGLELTDGAEVSLGDTRADGLALGTGAVELSGEGTLTVTAGNVSMNGVSAADVNITLGDEDATLTLQDADATLTVDGASTIGNVTAEKLDLRSALTAGDVEVTTITATLADVAAGASIAAGDLVDTTMVLDAEQVDLGDTIDTAYEDVLSASGTLGTVDLDLTDTEIQSFLQKGGIIQLVQDGSALDLQVAAGGTAGAEAVEITWTVGDLAASNGFIVDGDIVPFYRALDHVDTVIVTGDSEIDLSAASGHGDYDDPENDGPLQINSLAGTGTLSLKGDGAADAVTIYGTAADADISLKVEDMSVSFEKKAAMFMLRAMRSVSYDVTLNDYTISGESDQQVGLNMLVKGELNIGEESSVSVLPGGLLHIEGGLQGSGVITGEADITGTAANGSVFEGSYGTGATLNVLGGAQMLATGENLTVRAEGSKTTLALSGTEHITELAATDGATVMLMPVATADAPALSADSVDIDGADLVITLDTEDALKSATDGPVIIDSTGTADVASLTVNLTPAAALDVPTGEGAETVMLAKLMDGASAEDVSLTTNASGTMALLKKYFEMGSAMVDADGNIMVNRNLDYFTETTEDLLNDKIAKSGAAMLDRALVYANPQGNTEDYSQLADIMNTLENYAAAGDAEGVNRLAASVAGASTASLGAALGGDMQRQLRAIRNRTTTMGVDQCVVNHDMPYFNAWINAEGNRAELDADGYESGYTMDSWGGTVGFDVDASPQLTFGLALTAMYGEFTAKSAETATGDVDSYYLTAFARYVTGRWTHTFVAAAGMSDASLKRTVQDYKLDGDTDGNSIGLMYEVGYVFALDEDATACLQPVLNFTFAHSSLSGYTEKGGDAALEVDDMDMTTFTIGAGARLQAAVGENLYNRTSILEARALVKFNVGDTSCEGSNSLAAIPGSAASVSSAEMGTTALELGAGLTVPLGQEGGSIFVDASAEISTGYTNVNATAGYRINF